MKLRWDIVEWSLFPSPHTDSSRYHQLHPCSISQLQPVMTSPPPSSKPPQLSLRPVSHTHIHTRTLHQQMLHLFSRVISQFLPLRPSKPFSLASVHPFHVTCFKSPPTLLGCSDSLSPYPKLLHPTDTTGARCSQVFAKTPPSQHSGLDSDEPA